MKFETAHNIYKSIQKTKIFDLKDDLFKSAIRYSHIRARWSLATKDERIRMDDERTRAHNVFIDDCNILSREMKKISENNNWRLEIGQNRKAIGDFACFIHLFLSVKAG